MFQNYQTGLSIASFISIFFCGIGYILTLIFGWKNNEEWGLRKVMPVYTAALFFGLFFYGIGYFLVPKMNDRRQQNERSLEWQMQDHLPSRMSNDDADFHF